MTTCPRNSCSGSLRNSGGDIASLTSISPKKLLQIAKNFPTTSVFYQMATGEDGLTWSYHMRCNSCKRKFIKCGHCGGLKQVADFPMAYTDYLCNDCDEVTAIVGHG